MRSGRLDRRIALQRKTVSRSPSGQETEAWSSLGRRWASVAPVSGDERFAAPQYVARQQVEFLVRWSAQIADLKPTDRIVYPAPAESSPASIPNSSIYDILAVHEVGRREGLRIIAARLADA